MRGEPGAELQVWVSSSVSLFFMAEIKNDKKTGKFLNGTAPGPGRPKLPPDERERRKKLREIARAEKEKAARKAGQKNLPLSNPPDPAPAPQPDPPKKPDPAPAAQPAPGATEKLAGEKPQSDKKLFGEFSATPPPKPAPEPATTAGAPGADPTTNISGAGTAGSEIGSAATPPPKPEPGPAAAAPGTDPAPNASAASENNRSVATMIFQTFAQLLASIFGPFWLPRKVGNNLAAGEIPFDEAESVIQALTNYFKETGMMILSPLQQLYFAIGAYGLPRVPLTLKAWREKFRRKAPAAPPTAPGPESARAPEKPAPAAPAEKAEDPAPPNAGPDALKTDEALARFH